MNCKQFALGLLAASLALPAFAKDVATVNGVVIPGSRMSVLAEQYAAQGQGQQGNPAEMRNNLREELITIEVLRQAAEKKKLDKTPEFKNELDLLGARVMANLAVRDFVRSHPVTEAQLRTQYEQLRAKASQKEFRARHILVATEAEALAVLELLKKGKRFDELARERSSDAGSKENGGDLGWMAPNQLVPAFSKAMQALHRGEIGAKPVKTEYGWHVLKLDDVRDGEFPPMEAVRTQLTQKIQSESLQQYLTDLRKNAKVE